MESETAIPRLEEWSVRYLGSDDSYRAPEQRPQAISGAVYGHPRFSDGERVTTSEIVRVTGREVQTANTRYVLGKAADDYRVWCAEHGYGRDLDGEEPLEL